MANGPGTAGGWNSSWQEGQGRSNLTGCLWELQCKDHDHFERVKAAIMEKKSTAKWRTMKTPWQPNKTKNALLLEWLKPVTYRGAKIWVKRVIEQVWHENEWRLLPVTGDVQPPEAICMEAQAGMASVQVIATAPSASAGAVQGGTGTPTAPSASAGTVQGGTDTAMAVCVDRAQGDLQVKLVTGTLHPASNHYTMHKHLVLGHGTFGTVFSATAKTSGRSVAIKQLMADTAEQEVLAEVLFLELAASTNTVQLLDICFQQGIYSLVFERWGQSLDNELPPKTKEKRSSSEVQNLVWQGCKALAFIHSRHIIHTDLKPSNLLVAATATGLHLKLSDFGTAVHAHYRKQESRECIMKFGLKVTTLNFRAPEILFGKADFGTPVDMWSFGTIFAELALGGTLFTGHCQVDVCFKIWNRLSSLQDRAELASLPLYPQQAPNLQGHFWEPAVYSQLGHGGVALLNQMLRMGPSKRVTAGEALKADYLMPSQTQLLNSGQVFTGQRGPWNMVLGELSPDVLSWLRGDKFFDPASSCHEDLRLSWGHKPNHVSGKRQKLEEGRKIQVGGWVGKPGSSGINGIDASKPLPVARLSCWMSAFKAQNKNAIERLQKSLHMAISRLEQPGKNGNDFLEIHAKDWIGCLGILQFTKPGRWDEPWHFDGGASILHIGVTLAGMRHIAIRTADKSEILLQNFPGTVYICSFCGPEHQVRHSKEEAEHPGAMLMDIPRIGATQISAMLRSDMFRYNRGRVAAHSPAPKEVYEAARDTVLTWLNRERLQLPTLLECLKQLHDPSTDA